jgi:hypothetical protein
MSQDLNPRTDLRSRDPAGFLFQLKGRYYRAVAESYLPHLRVLESSGLYQKLRDTGLILPFEKIPAPPGSPVCAEVLEPEQLSFVSSPAEWSFSQWKEAALVTLRIQEEALRCGMTLKDATPYNIQLHRGKPVLIDSLSLESYEEGRPWQAYRQFCEEFLAPLLLAAYKGPDLLAGQAFFAEGVPLSLASRLLPFSSWFRPAALFHIHLHAKASGYSESKKLDEKSIGVGKNSLFGLVDGLRSAVSSLNLPGGKSEWSDYYSSCNYTDEALSCKKKIILEWLNGLPEAPVSAWDLGTNTGEFSHLLTDRGAEVLSLDTDHLCIDMLYRRIRSEKNPRIHPLKADISSPTPATGWMNDSRPSLFDRGGKRDMVLALALIHHLIIGRRADFTGLALLFSRLGRHVIVEYVAKEDPQAQRLLRTRQDLYPDYTHEAFLKAFAGRFALLDRREIPGTGRTLYFFKSNES